MKGGTSLTQGYCGQAEVDVRQGALGIIWTRLKRVCQLGNVFCATSLDIGTPFVPLYTQRLQRRRLTVVEATVEGVVEATVEGVVEATMEGMVEATVEGVGDSSIIVICMNYGLSCSMCEQCFNL
jgi:hypothetical protein